MVNQHGGKHLIARHFHNQRGITMKKLLILMILFPLVCFGQTRPHWSQIEGTSVVMNTDGSNSSDTVTLENLELTGNLLGVEANFTGDVSVGGVELMKTGAKSNWFPQPKFDPALGSLTGYSFELIPAEINGVPVTQVATSAFEDMPLNTSINIPSNIVTLNVSCFKNAGLTGLTFDEGLQTAGSGVFYGNNISGEVVLPNSLLTVDSSFLRENEITHLTIGTGLTVIPHSFARVNNLTALVLPANISEIGTSAFRDNPVVDITIGADVTISSATASTMGSNWGFRDYYISQDEAAGQYLWDGTEWTGPF